ncbi:hypothetical protein ACFY6U_44515 [Streptomyces sp. NPDC013157]|uniref:hypothetical protein n=1 Tax=Streptomyces sp. NPDC013157 TaxID=3364861 RepID=UPI00369331CF
MITPKELVGLLPPTFEPEYIDSAVVPFLMSRQITAERPALPMIDLALSKENAAPPHFWCMLYSGWEPNPPRHPPGMYRRPPTVLRDARD